MLNVQFQFFITGLCYLLLGLSPCEAKCASLIARVVNILRSNHQIDIPLPTRSLPYQALLNRAAPEFEESVRYLTPQELESFKIEIRNGVLWYRGSKMNTASAPTGKMLWVMDSQGQFYAAPRVGDIRHSSFFAGGPVAAAGEMIVADGQITLINRASGHYLPSIFHMRQAVTELVFQGVQVDGRVSDFDANSYEKMLARPRLAF